MVGHLNISSVLNKFELRKSLVYNSVDIFLVSETKIDSPFRNSKFRLTGDV